MPPESIGILVNVRLKPYCKSLASMHAPTFFSFGNYAGENGSSFKNEKAQQAQQVIEMQSARADQICPCRSLGLQYVIRMDTFQHRRADTFTQEPTYVLAWASCMHIFGFWLYSASQHGKASKHKDQTTECTVEQEYSSACICGSIVQHRNSRNPLECLAMLLLVSTSMCTCTFSIKSWIGKQAVSGSHLLVFPSPNALERCPRFHTSKIPAIQWQ
jgi:hypothetical protein